MSSSGSGGPGKKKFLQFLLLDGYAGFCFIDLYKDPIADGLSGITPFHIWLISSLALVLICLLSPFHTRFRQRSFFSSPSLLADRLPFPLSLPIFLEPNRSFPS
ncbi:hypothetical protein BJX61DRAFT_390655 [Aspergillus egyptiacus]|nr:hypothetical protein BJX61DRAFT_390655 [Aspergillus egyptiacus]